MPIQVKRTSHDPTRSQNGFTIEITGIEQEIADQIALLPPAVAEWGGITGSLADQTDLQTALNAKAGTGHNHAGVYEPANSNIQTHIAAAHAPADAQKNSDILKSEIEAKLTGVISSHSHAGGSDGEVSLFKAGDQAITSAGFVDVTGLSFSVAAGKAYLIEAHIVFRTSATAMACLLGFNGPASPTRISLLSRKEITAVATAGTDKMSEAVISAYDTANPLSTAEIAQNADLLHTFKGVFFNGANAGTFALRMSKENVAGTHTVMAGSWLRYRLLN